MKEKVVSPLNLEIDELESRERGGGSCTSSSTHSYCTCACKLIPGESET